MNKKYIFIGITILALVGGTLIFTGCVSDDKESEPVSTGIEPEPVSTGEVPFTTPEQTFKQLAEKGKEIPDGYFKYEVTVSSEQTIDNVIDASTSYNAEIYSLGGNAKKVAWLTGTPKAYYEIDGNFSECSDWFGNIRCEQESHSAFEAATGMAYLDLFRRIFGFVSSFGYAGNKEFAGRNCHEFSFVVSKEKLSELMPVVEAEGVDNPYKDARMEYSVCLDAEEGFIVNQLFELIKESNQDQETKTTSMGLELLEFDAGKVTQEDLRFPIDFEVKEDLWSFICLKDKIEIKLFYWNNFKGEAEVWFVPTSINEEEWEYIRSFSPADFTVSLDGVAGQTETLSITLDKLPNWGDNTVIICSEDQTCFGDDTCDFRSTMIDYESCSDSDGGDNLDTKGIVSYAYKDNYYSANNLKSGSREDECITSDYLMEWNCIGDRPESESESCSCVEGKCVD